jgi:hypothetical protein
MAKNEVVKRETGDGVAVPNINALAAGLRRTRAEMPATGGRGYLKFGKDGMWTLGKNGDALNGETVILNTNSLKYGYVCWTNYDEKERRKNEKLGEEMELATRGGVDLNELEDLGWDWKPQQAIDGKFVGADQKEFSYVTSSNGGLDLMGEIIDKVMARIDEGEDVYLFPVIQLNDDWYEHSRYGKIYTPIMEVVNWADISGNFETDAEGEEEEADEKPDPKPKKSKKKKVPEPEPEPKPEPEDEDEQEDEQEDETEEEAEDEPPRRRRRR